MASSGDATPTLGFVSDRTDNEATTVSLQLVSHDDDPGDVLTYSATGLPPGISITATTGVISGTIPYSAASPSGALYTVTVTVRDSSPSGPGGTFTDADRAVRTFYWTVNNVDTPPMLAAIANRTNDEGAVIALQAVAADLDGDVLSYSAINLPPGLAINPATGLISGTIAYTAADASDAVYNVTLAAIDNTPTGPGGTYAATDRASMTFAWTIRNVDTTPAVAEIRDLIRGAVITDSVSSSKFDTVSLQVVGADTDGGILTYSVDGLPPGLSVDPVGGLISGTIATSAVPGANPNTVATFPVTVTVTDDTPSGPGGTFGPADRATRTFTWLVRNTVFRVSLQVTRSTNPLSNGDFESDWPGGWSIPLANTLPVARSGDSYHSPRFSALLGNPQIACLSGSPAATAVAEQRISIPTTGSATLSFWYRMLSEDVAVAVNRNNEPSDRLEVFIVNGAGGMTTLGRFGRPYTQDLACGRWWDSGWQQATYSLSSFAGQTITLRFTLSLDPIDGMLNSYAYLDDVVVTWAP